MNEDPIAGNPDLLGLWTKLIMALVLLLSAMWGLDIGLDGASPYGWKGMHVSFRYSEFKKSSSNFLGKFKVRFQPV